jgi:hypothetical protein
MKLHMKSPHPKTFLRKARDAASAIHVFPGSSVGQWEVKEIGVKGLKSTFSSKAAAVVFAKQHAADKKASIRIHSRHPRLKVSSARHGGVFELVVD